MTGTPDIILSYEHPLCDNVAVVCLCAYVLREEGGGGREGERELGGVGEGAGGGGERGGG